MKNVIQHAFKKGSLDQSVQIAGPANRSCFFKSFSLPIVRNQSPHARCPKMEKGVVRSIPIAFNLKAIKEDLELVNEFRAVIHNGVLKFSLISKASPSKNKQ